MSNELKTLQISCVPLVQQRIEKGTKASGVLLKFVPFSIRCCLSVKASFITHCSLFIGLL